MYLTADSGKINVYRIHVGKICKHNRLGANLVGYYFFPVKCCQKRCSRQ